MKKILISFFFLLAYFASISAFAEKKSAEDTCTTENHCAIDKSFNVRVDRIKKSGDFILLQLKYKSTVGYNYSVKYEQASLVDDIGNEVIIEGSNITGFSIRSRGSEKNVSLRFKADGFKWGKQFHLEIKANEPHGAIAFFNLVPK